ncbi:MAG: LysR family transcriptional regulator [Lachnospiraceae bacterium]|nr:LysR family transcriptional regulator [Lachnospiraceae bacterium]
MELQQLSYFILTAEYENISQAAKALYISQPSLSASIHRLETELGMKLFDRQGRKISLNDNGRQFLETARTVLSLLEKSKLHASVTDQPSGIIRIAMHVMSEQFLLCLENYNRYNPHVQFQISEAAQNSPQQSFATADFVVFSGEDADCPHIPIDTQFLCAIVPCTHPLANQNTLHLIDLKEEDFVFIALNGTTLERAYRLCLASGFTPRVRYLVNGIYMKTCLISSQAAIGIVPSTDLRLLTHNTTLKSIPLEQTSVPSLKIQLGWEDKEYISEAVSDFRKYALHFFQNISEAED